MTNAKFYISQVIYMRMRYVFNSSQATMHGLCKNVLSTIMGFEPMPMILWQPFRQHPKPISCNGCAVCDKNKSNCSSSNMIGCFRHLTGFLTSWVEY